MESKERSEFTGHSLWAFEPLFDGLRQGRDLLLLARLSARGIYQLEERYDHLQQFAEFNEHFVYEDESFKTVMKTYTLGNNHYLRLPQDKLAIELEHAADGAEAAREERARNYAGINNQTFVSAWGMLEDTIRISTVPCNLDLLRVRREQVALHLEPDSKREKAHQPKVQFLRTTFGLQGSIGGCLYSQRTREGVLLRNRASAKAHSRKPTVASPATTTPFYSGQSSVLPLSCCF